MFSKTLMLISCCISLPELIAADCNKERKCKTSRVHGLRSADCYRMDMREFPKCLSSNTEALELSYNRIRKVTKEDLRRYPYMVHLYLMDNLIVNLDDDVFQESSSLRTIDLSVNALKKVPPTLFQLPSLTTLYLSQNLNINVAESIDEAKPISQSCLTKLDMSYITEDGSSTDFPDFRELPLLAFLNITGVNFNYISTRHFAGLCNLQILGSENVSAEFEHDCDCERINRWLLERKVKYTELVCPTNEIDCSNKPIDVEDLEVYQNCRAKYAKISRSLYLEKVWHWLGIAAGGLVLTGILVGCCIWKHIKQKKAMEARESLRQRENRQLLNNQTKV
ncbi:unnamed protein product [Ceutorhynchus assimilis]|uniref:Uncharacterized protein n=1 Tax=Ceutorhynchus assimilis TaxID=467358 RepID=A0A9N9MAC0_9CUCU|nr:unnamed protein product [Ceutorhynchus assimilis]